MVAIKRANGIELDPYKDEFLDAPLLAAIPESGEVISSLMMKSWIRTLGNCRMEFRLS